MDYGSDYIQEYKNEEQPNTLFNLDDRVKMYGTADITEYHDIVVEFDAKMLTSQNFQILVNLSDLLRDSGEVGEMDYEIFKFHIKSLETYEKDLILIK